MLDVLSCSKSWNACNVSILSCPKVIATPCFFAMLYSNNCKKRHLSVSFWGCGIASFCYARRVGRKLMFGSLFFVNFLIVVPVTVLYYSFFIFSQWWDMDWQVGWLVGTGSCVSGFPCAWLGNVAFLACSRVSHAMFVFGLSLSTRLVYHFTPKQSFKMCIDFWKCFWSSWGDPVWLAWHQNLVAYLLTGWLTQQFLMDPDQFSML